MDRGAWWGTVHGVAKSRTQQRDEHFHFHQGCKILLWGLGEEW